MRCSGFRKPVGKLIATDSLCRRKPAALQAHIDIIIYELSDPRKNETRQLYCPILPTLLLLAVVWGSLWPLVMHLAALGAAGPQRVRKKTP